MSKLAVYEPPYIVDESRERPGPDLADRLTALVAAGRRGDAVAAAIPNAQHRFLDGQDHRAADDVLGPVLVGFARDPAPEHVSQ